MTDAYRANEGGARPATTGRATPLDAWRSKGVPRDIRELGERLIAYKRPLSRDEAGRLIDYVKRNMPELRDALSVKYAGYPEDQIEALKLHADWAFAYATSWPQNEDGSPSDLVFGPDGAGNPTIDARIWHEERRVIDGLERQDEALDRNEAETLGLPAATPVAAHRRLSTLSAKEPEVWAALNDRNHPGHAAALDEWSRLQRLAHGGQAVAPLIAETAEAADGRDEPGGASMPDAPAGRSIGSL